jgi:hypothetical protein
MQQHSPSCETNRFSASKEIFRNLWNPKSHYRAHRSTQTASVLNKMDPVLALFRILFDLVFLIFLALTVTNVSPKNAPVII